MNRSGIPHNPNDQLDHLYAVISGQRFLAMQGLGNEVPFFICPYEIQKSQEMDKIYRSLLRKLERENVRVLDLSLYDLSIEILKNRGIWEQVLEIERETSKDELKELLQSVLDSENHLIPAVAEKIRAQEYDVLFLTGVGEVFPYIRSHNVLNNLQSTAKEKPTVLFFPGEYTHSLDVGASLDLFGILHDDKYYRAFNIYHCEP